MKTETINFSNITYTRNGDKIATVKRVDGGFRIHLLGQFPDLETYKTIPEAVASVKRKYALLPGQSLS